MFATFINAGAVIIGSLIGLLLNKRIGEQLKTVVYAGIGVVTLVIGFSMALETQRVLYFALAIAIGGVLGTWWKVEGAILSLGEVLHARFSRSSAAGDFAYGFLSASVLFCVGAMAIVGSFQAGVDGNYELLFTKSVMDGFLAVLLTATLGIGVAFSSVMILLYQGALTLLAVWIRPWVSELLISEISAVGGALVIMIGITLLDLKQIKTANFVPAILVVILLVVLDPWLPL